MFPCNLNLHQENIPKIWIQQVTGAQRRATLFPFPATLHTIQSSRLALNSTSFRTTGYAVDRNALES